jgi:hypothetical protein
MLTEKKQPDTAEKSRHRSRRRTPWAERSWADAGDAIPGETERQAGLSKRHAPRIGLADWSNA